MINKHVAPSVDDAIYTVRAYAVHSGMTKTELARAAGLRDTTLRHFWRPDWAVTAAILRILQSVIPADFDPTAAELRQKVETIMQRTEQRRHGTRTQSSGNAGTGSQSRPVAVKFP